MYVARSPPPFWKQNTIIQCGDFIADTLYRCCLERGSFGKFIGSSILVRNGKTLQPHLRARDTVRDCLVSCHVRHYPPFPMRSALRARCAGHTEVDLARAKRTYTGNSDIRTLPYPPSSRNSRMCWTTAASRPCNHRASSASNFAMEPALKQFADKIPVDRELRVLPP